MFYKLPKRKQRMSEGDKLFLVFGLFLVLIKLCLAYVLTH